MKLQNLTVIFIIIVLPLVLILSYYISLQVDTSNMQASYNSKLLNAVKEAIEAFEINTVEWNESYSETGDSKRRDVMASINTFTTSFANSLGLSGATSDYVLSYVPAIAITMYDGYYIYSPSETKVVIEDENGVGVVMSESLLQKQNDKGEDVVTSYDEDDLEKDQGKILYKLNSELGAEEADGIYNEADGDEVRFTLDASKAEVEYTHILKPFNSYSARYVNGSTDITINYTLDNYITIYGKVNGKDYDIRSGYLIDTTTVDINGINDIEVNGVKIEAESLTETIYYDSSDEDEEGLDGAKSFPYVYEAGNNTKVYFDENNTPFQVSSTGERTNLEDTTTVMYKKISILSDDDQYYEIFQALNSGNAYKYVDATTVETVEVKAGTWYYGTIDSTGDIRIIKEYDGTVEGDSLTTDYSAINYYVESYCFTKWVEDNLDNITVSNMITDTLESSEIVDGETEEEYETTGKIFDGNYESDDSTFQNHKKEVMKNLLINNLNQAITSYAGKNTDTEYQLPVLEETDWDQILNNVSITAFVQGIPIGMKYYNNYAIATSTNNKEYVNPSGIYLNGSDGYYHLYGCSKLSGDSIIGYRSSDYIEKSYETDEESVVYYARHPDNNKLCYYCLIDRNVMEVDYTDSQTEAYLTALARERFNQAQTQLETAEIEIEEPEEEEPEVEEPEEEEPEVDSNIPQEISLQITIDEPRTLYSSRNDNYTVDWTLSYDYDTTITYTYTRYYDDTFYETECTLDNDNYKITDIYFPSGASTAVITYNVTITTTDNDGNVYEGNINVYSLYYLKAWDWNDEGRYLYIVSFEYPTVQSNDWTYTDTTEVTLTLQR